MKFSTIVLVLISCCTASSAFAIYSVTNKGIWPQSWPKELEPLRDQARSLRGSQVDLTFYEISFKSRKEFEEAWPHLLKIKTKGAPIFLLSAPNQRLGTELKAGVRIQTPPPLTKQSGQRPIPIPGKRSTRQAWIYGTFIELIVDGDIVDLNRIQLPKETPIIDERFENKETKSSTQPEK